MIRYPLYKGGLILLPENVVRALYVLEEAKHSTINMQKKLIEKMNCSHAAVSDLNSLRTELLKVNSLEYPVKVDEVIEMLLDCSVIEEQSGSYRINYNASIERTPLILTKDVIHAVQDVRAFYRLSDDMISYINQLNPVKPKYKISDEPAVLLANNLIEDAADPIEWADRTRYIYEVSLLEKGGVSDEAITH